MSFGRTLKEFRVKQGLSQGQVVELLSMHADLRALTTVSYHRWEAGKVVPNIKKQALIYLILRMNEELLRLLEFSFVGVQSKELFEQKRWSYARTNNLNPYDFSLKKELTLAEAQEFDEIPKQLILFHEDVYLSPNDHFEYRNFINLCDVTRIFYFHDGFRYYGHAAFHIVNKRLLDNHLQQLNIELINSLANIKTFSDDVIMISSEVSTRRDVNSYLRKKVLEVIIKLEQIPSHTFFRVYTEEFASLTEAELSPTFIAGNSSGPSRVKRGAKEYSWVGYLVPTHLFLLNFWPKL